MSHHSTVLSQLLKLIPRHEFQALSEQRDSKRRVGALSRCSQFVAMFNCQVSGLSSLRDIEVVSLGWTVFPILKWKPCG